MRRPLSAEDELSIFYDSPWPSVIVHFKGRQETDRWMSEKLLDCDKDPYLSRMIGGRPNEMLLDYRYIRIRGMCEARCYFSDGDRLRDPPDRSRFFELRKERRPGDGLESYAGSFCVSGINGQVQHARSSLLEIIEAEALPPFELTPFERRGRRRRSINPTDAHSRYQTGEELTRRVGGEGGTSVHRADRTRNDPSGVRSSSTNRWGIWESTQASSSSSSAAPQENSRRGYKRGASVEAMKLDTQLRACPVVPTSLKDLNSAPDMDDNDGDTLMRIGEGKNVDYPSASRRRGRSPTPTASLSTSFHESTHLQRDASRVLSSVYHPPPRVLPQPAPYCGHAKKGPICSATMEPDSNFRACFLEFSALEGPLGDDRRGTLSHTKLQRWAKGCDLFNAIDSRDPLELMEAVRKRKALLCGQMALISKFLCPNLRVLEECHGPLLYRGRADRVFFKNGTLTVIVGDGRYNAAEVLNRPSKKQKKMLQRSSAPAPQPMGSSASDRACEIQEMERAVVQLVEAWEGVTTNTEGQRVPLSAEILQSWLTKALAGVGEEDRLACAGVSKRRGCLESSEVQFDELALLPFSRKAELLALSVKPLFAAKDYPHGDSSGDHPSFLDLDLDPNGHVISRVLEGELEEEASRRLQNDVFVGTLCKATCNRRQAMRKHLKNANHTERLRENKRRPTEPPRVSPASGARPLPEIAVRLTAVSGFLWEPRTPVPCCLTPAVSSSSSDLNSAVRSLLRLRDGTEGHQKPEPSQSVLPSGGVTVALESAEGSGGMTAASAQGSGEIRECATRVEHFDENGGDAQVPSVWIQNSLLPPQFSAALPCPANAAQKETERAEFHFPLAHMHYEAVADGSGSSRCSKTTTATSGDSHSRGAGGSGMEQQLDRTKWESRVVPQRVKPYPFLRQAQRQSRLPPADDNG
uniref:Uncharacterized protein n=1 Tax=Chromera velia CCMP2878 TaxID=1169474 RepID=A0A0G4GUC7_9ALVE|eukprot:Cvel_23418.t1-p1 / transcript=Cvel_23418.t1 / gene=Cvel_23418 / organism=Chromera_velia_CCMP2878 / gene_product=hypothetical protein / transcript_product=hypothetical protein / location=Cvel_scaffold2412:10127-15356(+) / protein_length=922 / sequence_SO=supercontig / SO=protein_coding / is_pseudo=false